MGARVIENWADVTGLVLETRPGHREDFLELNLQIESAADVEGMANLVAPLVGKTLWVNIPQELAHSIGVQVGDLVQAGVRRVTGELAFVHNEYVTVHRVRMAAPPSRAASMQNESTPAEADADRSMDSKRQSNESGQHEATQMGNVSGPPVLVAKGFQFHFCMADFINEPPHVCVDRDGKTAKFWLSPLRVSDPGKFSGKEIRQIERIVSQHVEQLVESWNLERAKLP